MGSITRGDKPKGGGDYFTAGWFIAPWFVNKRICGTWAGMKPHLTLTPLRSKCAALTSK